MRTLLVHWPPGAWRPPMCGSTCRAPDDRCLTGRMSPEAYNKGYLIMMYTINKHQMPAVWSWALKNIPVIVPQQREKEVSGHRSITVRGGLWCRLCHTLKHMRNDWGASLKYQQTADINIRLLQIPFWDASSYFESSFLLLVASQQVCHWRMDSN